MTPASINIDTAEQVGDFRILLNFDDGTEQNVDFKPFLTHDIFMFTFREASWYHHV